MNPVFRFLKFIKYFFSAGTADSIHSPFVFDLYTNLITDRIPYYVFEKIEDLRFLLLNDKKKINVVDFGAKSYGKSPVCSEKKIKCIARNAASGAKYGQLLFRLVNKFQPENILELGTSLGLGTMYLASSSSVSKVITIEASEEIAEIAKKNFQKIRINNIEQVVGNFDELLPSVLEHFNANLDFVFFDGNHRKAPTLRYFNLCLAKANSESVFVFDDIHWSQEMEEAWEEIKKNEKIRVTVDLFFSGIVFFRKELSRQDFVLRF